eukprot:802890_1
MAVEDNGNSTGTTVAIVAILLIFILVAACFLFYFCVYRKKRKLKQVYQEKTEQDDGQMMAMRDEDGCNETNITKDMMETIEIEKEIEVEVDP